MNDRNGNELRVGDDVVTVDGYRLTVGAFIGDRVTTLFGGTPVSIDPSRLILLQTSGTPRLDFDPEAGAAARDEGIDRAVRNADPAWRDEADRALQVTIDELGRDGFTSDDVWERMDPDVASTREPRAMAGPLMAARGRGEIEPSNRFENSRRTAAHRSPKRVWYKTGHKPGGTT